MFALETPRPTAALHASNLRPMVQGGRDADVRTVCPDHTALRYFANRGECLCTLVAVEGSYSRKVGAQLAIAPDGSLAGDLADHCLEAELAQQAKLSQADRAPRIALYGRGSPMIDFRLPCGSKIQVLINPLADREAALKVVSALDDRKPASLDLPVLDNDAIAVRHYIPSLRIVAFGEGPDADSLRALAAICGADVGILPAASSARKLDGIATDPWTAIVCLSHDHEWERTTLPWALASDAFYVGAIGGEKARLSREEMLSERGVPAAQIERLHAPVGLFGSARHPKALALSALSEIVSIYEGLRDG
ncbi:MAG: XdhC family protein [Pseudomonadota bacterium]